MRSAFLLIACLLALLMAQGCYEHNEAPDGDGDGDSDTDVDGDGDGDGDGDVDGDGDSDIDGDADSDVDGDADSDVDGDADSDVDGDGDGDADYVVHEWGVFTDSGAHAGRRLWQGEMADKPVLYFYPTRPLTVDVEVGFPGGRATETWPELVLGRNIRWSGVQVSPDPCTSWTDFPSWDEGQCPEADMWMCEASELGNYVVPEAGCLETDGVTSPLLFYAGALGESPVATRGQFCSDCGYDGVRVWVRNILDEPVGPVLLVYRNLQGDCEPWGCTIHYAEIGTAWIEHLVPGEESEIEIRQEILDAGPDGVVEPPEWLMGEWERLVGAVQEAGLSRSEAEAMIDAWGHTLFDLQPNDDMVVTVPMEESVLTAAVLPQEVFDRALPIELTPAPRELVRVGLSMNFLQAVWMGE